MRLGMQEKSTGEIKIFRGPRKRPIFKAFGLEPGPPLNEMNSFKTLLPEAAGRARAVREPLKTFEDESTHLDRRDSKS